MLELGVPAMFLAGVATSPHCALMCAPLQALALGDARGARARSLAALHGGRVLGYAGLGALAGGVGGAMLPRLPDLAGGEAVRLLGALALVAAGVMHWRHARRASCPMHAARRAPVASLRQQVGRGLAWALVPCGLVYAMLVLASLSGSAPRGALLLLAFGIGTVPLASASGALLARLRATSQLRPAVGALLVAVGIGAGAVSLAEATPLAALCRAWMG